MNEPRDDSAAPIYTDLFQTLWSEDGEFKHRPVQPRYVIVSMTGWSYDGPVDRDGHYELELECTVGDHPRVRLFYEERGLQGGSNWPRIIGTHEQGITGANREPTALLLCFESEKAREAFKEYWPLYGS